MKQIRCGKVGAATWPKSSAPQFLQGAHLGAVAHWRRSSGRKFAMPERFNA